MQPATVDEVHAVFAAELTGDAARGPMSAFDVANRVALVRIRAERGQAAFMQAQITSEFDAPSVEDAIAQLVADGRLVTVLGQSVRRAWRRKYGGPFERDRAYYARAETVELWRSPVPEE